MEKLFSVDNLDCAHCGSKIEEAISRLEGIESASLNYPLKKLRISGELTDELINKVIETARMIEAEVVLSPLEHTLHHEHEHHHKHNNEFSSENLDCAHCGAKIEEAISKLGGVESAVLNFPMRKIKISGNITDELLEEINRTASSIEAGVVISPAVHDHHHHHEGCECCHGHEEEHEHAHEAHHRHFSEKNPLKMDIVALLIGVALFASAVLSSRLLNVKAVPVVLFAAAYIILGHNVLLSTYKNIKAKNFFDENFLMTVATIGAFALGEYAEAVGVVLFFRIGELFEEYAVSRSRKAITDVAELKVNEADVLIDGEFKRVSSDSIKAGDILRIKAGERIAADGIIEEGSSRLDTSAVNGEPVPLTVRKGDAVMSGCINLSEVLTLRATAAAADSMISKIAKAVEDASAEKPKVDRFITRFAKIYTPVVIAIALFTAIVPSLITGSWSKWIYSALTFLVISCPCALVLSVPLAYFSGIGAASKLGILFKGGSSLEALGKVKTIAFDKTGTLTNGNFTVTDITSYGELDSDELLRICGSCEQISTHPVAESIIEYCHSKKLSLVSPENAGEIAGRGVKAVLGGKELLCGNEKLMSENGLTIPDTDSPFGSVVYIAADGKIQGRIIVSDTIKETSVSAVSQLRRMGLKTAMLTGDKRDNALSVAREIGIDEVAADLLPDEKLAEIEHLRKENGAVMFIGDGFNDGPVLAGADVGAAMHNGSDLALEAADAVFMNPEPESVVRSKKIADKTLRISYENIIFALAVKAAVLILGLIGHANMWFAVFADSGAAMICILNAVRVLNTKRY